MDDRQLLALLEPGPRDPARLAVALGMPDAQVVQALERLRQAGVALHSDARGRWSLPQPLDLHDRPALLAGLAPATVQAIAGLEVLWSVDSTNSELLRRPVPDTGLAVVLAESQQSGRGRRGRQWHSPLGRHLYLSLGWCSPHGLAPLAGLSVVVGVVVAEVLRACGLAAGLKWPNDLLLDGAKLGGILVETAGPARGPLQVVAGVGLNVHGRDWEGSSIDQPWTAIDGHLAQRPCRDALAAALLDALVPALALHRAQGLAPFLERYAALDLLAGQPIWVDDGNGRSPARALGLAGDGGLRISDGRGERCLHAGVVSVRKQ